MSLPNENRLVYILAKPHMTKPLQGTTSKLVGEHESPKSMSSLAMHGAEQCPVPPWSTVPRDVPVSSGLEGWLGNRHGERGLLQVTL